MWLGSAEYISDYKIKVVFEDGLERAINLKQFLTDTKNPLIKKFLDIEKFQKFHVEYGALCWEENDFDLSPDAIYRGDFDDVKIKKRNHKPKNKERIFKV